MSVKFLWPLAILFASAYGDLLLFKDEPITVDEKGYLYLNIIPKPGSCTQITEIDDYVRMEVNGDAVEMKAGAEEIFEYLSNALDVPKNILHLYLYYPSGRKTILLSRPIMTVPVALEKLKNSAKDHSCPIRH